MFLGGKKFAKYTNSIYMLNSKKEAISLLQLEVMFHAEKTEIFARMRTRKGSIAFHETTTSETLEMNIHKQLNSIAYLQWQVQTIDELSSEQKKHLSNELRIIVCESLFRIENEMQIFICAHGVGRAS